MSPSTEPELAVHGGSSICEQIRTQIRDYVVVGQLTPGEQLPTVRGVAVALGINPAIVSKAYHELERDGFLTSQDGSGYFVTGLEGSTWRPPECQAELERLCVEFLAQAAQNGYSSADVIAALETLTQRRIVQ
jgi:GntR family transcriptional regulator